MHSNESPIIRGQTRGKQRYVQPCQARRDVAAVSVRASGLRWFSPVSVAAEVVNTALALWSPPWTEDGERTALRLMICWNIAEREIIVSM